MPYTIDPDKCRKIFIINISSYTNSWDFTHEKKGKDFFLRSIIHLQYIKLLKQNRTKCQQSWMCTAFEFIYITVLEICSSRSQCPLMFCLKSADITCHTSILKVRVQESKWWTQPAGFHSLETKTTLQDFNFQYLASISRKSKYIYKRSLHKVISEL